MSIGNNIKTLRISKRWSQEELAKRLDVAPSTVSSWELGVKTPRMGIIQKLSDMFGISKSYIIENEITLNDTKATEITNIIKNSDSLMELFDVAKNLSDDDIRQVTRIASTFGGNND